MLELMLCSFLTIFPDYLFRRYVQGRRIGREITLYSFWYELRWGITGCLILTVTLITVVFYNHPSTTNVTSFFRTVPILPEGSGRVAEVYVNFSGEVKKGDPIFRLDSSKQEAALETARRQVIEVEASMSVARTDLAGAEGQIQQAQSSLQQAMDELETKQELNRRSPDTVARREVERLQNVVDGRRGALDAAKAAREGALAKLTTLLPSQKALAEAAREQAQVELGKMVVYAGVSGRVEQFALRVGDIVNPFMRPAGVLIPTEAGRGKLQAGFGQIEAQVMEVGMFAEVSCLSKPFEVFPMVVTGIQDFIATGQFRAGEQLVDVNQLKAPGSILVFMEPLYEGTIQDIPPGSSCIANAYTNNHDKLQSEDLGQVQRLYLHMVDAVALVHAMILRVQVLLLPVKMLVFSGH